LHSAELVVAELVVAELVVVGLDEGVGAVTAIAVGAALAAEGMSTADSAVAVGSGLGGSVIERGSGAGEQDVATRQQGTSARTHLDACSRNVISGLAGA
jgi:hypothetical protein